MADNDQPAQNGADSETAVAGSWMSDVQRALALLLIGTFCFAVIATVIRVVVTAEVVDVLDVGKTALAALVNMALIGLGFFFGNTIAKLKSDQGQQGVIDKLTSTPPGTLPPAPGGAPVPPWWSRLTDAEKTAISNASGPDPRITSIISAMQVGAATPDDLDYLVTKGLLTADRATAIRAG